MKIDAGLVARVDEDPSSAEIVGALVTIGAELDVPVSAEGVTTEEQHRALVLLGGTVGQGPLYGEPALGDHLLFRHLPSSRTSKLPLDR